MNRQQRRDSHFQRGAWQLFDPTAIAVVKNHFKADAQATLAPAIMSRPLDEAEALNLRLLISAGWDALRTFTGSVADWGLIAQCLNDATVRAETISLLLIVPLNRAAAAMERMRDRHTEGLSLGPDGEGLLSVPEGLAIYDEILIGSSPKQMIDADREALRRSGRQAEAAAAAACESGANHTQEN